MSMKRLFVGVPLTDETRDRLADELKSKAPLPERASPPANWHVTLSFLGETNEERMNNVADGLRRLELPRTFSISLEGLGSFPNEKRAKILWLGVGKGLDVLNELAERVLNFTENEGFPREKRPFSAHLTLSRLKKIQDVGAYIKENKITPLEMAVDRICLFESLGGPRGAEYAVLEEYFLT